MTPRPAIGDVGSPTQADRRRNVLSLTPAGRAALREVDVQLDGAQDVILAPLDGEEREQLRELLTRVLEHHRAAR